MGIPTLLLNAFIIIICILSYQVFWLDKIEKKSRNHLLISVLSSIAVILCMTFPIHLHDGYIYDLRFIPILLVLLYGNKRSIIWISIVYMGYRFYLGGNGFVSSVVIYMITTSITTILRCFFPAYFRRNKILFHTLLLFICTSFFSISALINQIGIDGKIEDVFICFLINYVVVNAFTGLLSIYLVEGMIEKCKMKEKIQRAEKFYTASELAASIAHEVYNPLTTVYGFTQLFLENELSKTSRDEYLKIMMMELEKVQLIINDYLSLIKPGNTTKKTLNINCVFREVTNMISPLACSYNVEIQKDIPECLHIEANPEKLKQCFTNILQNGIEAMKDGGVLQIHAKRVKGNLVIDIVDSGIGMSRTEINRIATPFYATKEKGTGLGTMIAYSIIRELNGDIEIESTKGKGTCFSIIIPY